MNLRLFAVLFTGLGAVMVIGLKPALISTYIAYFSLSPSHAGVVTAAEMVGAMAGTVVVAVSMHRIDRRLVAFAGLALVLSGNLLSMLIPSFEPLTALRLMTGLGVGLASGVMAAAIAGMTSPDRIFGGFTVMTLLVAAAGFAIIPWLTDIAGPYAIFLLIAFVTLPGLLLAAWFPVSSGSPGSARSNRIPKLFLTRPNAMAIGGTIGFYLAVGGVWPYIAEVGLQAGFRAQQVSNVLAGSQVWGAVGALVPLIIGLRYGRAWPVAIALMLMVTGLSAIALAPRSFLVYAVVVQIYMGMWLVFFPYMMGVMAGLDHHGRLASFSYTLQSIGFAAGPALAAMVVVGGRFAPLLWSGVFFHLAAFVLMVPVAFMVDGADRRVKFERSDS
ncbi:MAG: MFS transporter [Gammaproteobacteria bacterium]|nr:MFS transporter [Gammaproteobacteria bacterium]